MLYKLKKNTVKDEKKNTVKDEKKSSFFVIIISINDFEWSMVL